MKFNFYYKLIVIATILSAHTMSSFGQKGFFSPAPSNTRMDQSLSKHIDKFLLYRLKANDLRSYLLNAPMEFKSPGTSGLTLEIPLPNGTVETFSMFESPVLSPEVAAKHPEIKTYAGKGVTHGDYSIRVNLTAVGFNAIILGVDGETVYFDKVSTDTSDNLYRNYFIRDAQSPQKFKTPKSNGKCGTLEFDGRKSPVKKTNTNERTAATSATGTTLRTFRLVMAGDAEYTAKKGGKVAAYAALLSYVSNLNAVYRQELSVTLTLISDDNLVFDNTLTDGYSDDVSDPLHQDKMLVENQAKIDGLFTDAGYDIGHVLGYEGSSGAGLAVSSSVTETGYKAQGVSSIGDGTFADVFDQQLIQHEIGHQFGMSHSYNSNVPVCTTWRHETSVEPGAGTTIMSYGYTCDNSDPANGLVGDDNYENSYQPILNFHTANYDQANNYINGITPFANLSTGNAIPVITPMTTTWTVPKSTPFVLTGTATDANASDVLSYSWEGTNLSDAAVKTELTLTTISDPSKPPFFRSYSPVSSSTANAGTRYYPRLSAILDGSNYAKGDKLPSIGIATTHRLTVRDNNSGLTYQDVTVNIDGGSGPFVITNDIAGSVLGPIGSYPIGGAMFVNWSPNNTQNATVNCTLVDIFLSTDGGLTFPTTLVTGALNSLGTAPVVLPLISTSQARIKIAPSTLTSSVLSGSNTPNIFFDISNVNFTIGTPLPVNLTAFNVVLKEKNNASLTWATTEETNNSGFDIEMSTDARKFIKVGFVEGKGNLKGLKNYNYSISDLSAGNYYFRLKQIDYDGKFEYSTIKALSIDNADDIVSIYPNPTNDKVKLNSNLHKNQAFSIEVANQSGQIVLRLPLSATYTNGYELDATKFPTGLYFVVLKGSNFIEKLKFVKL